MTEFEFEARIVLVIMNCVFGFQAQDPKVSKFSILLL